MPAGDVVLLVVDNSLCRIAAWRLAQRFPDLTIIVEQHVPRPSGWCAAGSGGTASAPHGGTDRLHPLFAARPPRRRGAHRADHCRLRDSEARWPDGIERIEVVSVKQCAGRCLRGCRNLSGRRWCSSSERASSAARCCSAVEAPFINYQRRDHAEISRHPRRLLGERPERLRQFRRHGASRRPRHRYRRGALPGAAPAVGRGQLCDLFLPAARRRPAASRARRRGRDRRDRDAAGRRPAIAPVVAPDDLALFYDAAGLRRGAW